MADQSFLDSLKKDSIEQAKKEVKTKVLDLHSQVPRLKELTAASDEGRLAEFKREVRSFDVEMPVEFWRAFDTIGEIMENTELITPLDKATDLPGQLKNLRPDLSWVDILVTHSVMSYIIDSALRADQVVMMDAAVNKLKKIMPGLVEELQKKEDESDPE